VKNLRYFLAPKHVLWLLEISGAIIDVNEANVAREFVVKRDDTRLNSNEEVRTPGKYDLYTLQHVDRENEKWGFLYSMTNRFWVNPYMALLVMKYPQITSLRIYIFFRNRMLSAVKARNLQCKLSSLHQIRFNSWNIHCNLKFHKFIILL